MDSTWTRRKSFYHKLAKMPWCEVVHNVFFWSLHITSIKVTFSSSTSERIWHRLLPSLCHCHIYVDVEPEHSAKLTKCNKSTTLLNIFCDKKIEQKLHKEWKGYTVIRITQYTQVADVEDTMHSISISMGDKIADCTWCLIFLSFFSFFFVKYSLSFARCVYRLEKKNRRPRMFFSVLSLLTRCTLHYVWFYFYFLVISVATK